METMRCVDARGLRCPLPVLRLRRAAEGAQPGDRLELLATDPAARRDVPAFCAEKGWVLESADDQPDGATRYRVRIA